ncbi:aromatic-ring-hydroxylating dioxygenase subunit beta [Parapusillimonas granuli]|uniref:Aromatic-ring-hydroxylating dioxygenase subunit beta n=1 Tax=Parapusillimonas granuli TaxID=380911 RepID=A0A853G5Y1_9BURK|nr:3-phenylpropionate/cinnamic acid dioxygenase small subunit [Parapusillimonas granuli]MEB2400177.1 aromatic-ring-hydroxylating dioxygenase subunit beta [Alcaligenaceae bacterium]NYT49996.1 aromatic-ring-hydroxylating dioxygenase subunit beta [Parapusillimonas granuli]
MTASTIEEKACRIVLTEARLLDEKRWDDWLALYADTAVLWMPTWRNERELTEDPDTELSFIYLEGKPALKERISRITSGLSVSSMPDPRTCHMVAGLRAQAADGVVQVESSWTSHIYDHKRKSHLTYFGHYGHTLQATADGLRILHKRIVLMNDYLESKLDFYYV